jgi:hypothetical protein
MKKKRKGKRADSMAQMAECLTSKLMSSEFKSQYHKKNCVSVCVCVCVK